MRYIIGSVEALGDDKDGYEVGAVNATGRTLELPDNWKDVLTDRQVLMRLKKAYGLSTIRFLEVSNQSDNEVIYIDVKKGSRPHFQLIGEVL